jgi:hypothetical protein
MRVMMSHGSVDYRYSALQVPTIGKSPERGNFGTSAERYDERPLHQSWLVPATGTLKMFKRFLFLSNPEKFLPPLKMPQRDIWP